MTQRTTQTTEKIIRFFDTELRATDTEKNDMLVEGYALKFDTITQIGSDKWGWKEKINRSALNGAKTDNVVLNFNHSMSNLLAGTRNNSLSLLIDDIGLKISAKIIDTAIGRDIYKMIQDKLINRMSFAAIVKESTWTISENDNEMDLREITSFDRFFDVSAVTFPAYEDTTIVARSEELATRKREIYFRQLEKINYILGGK